jgi:hypothetical protein
MLPRYLFQHTLVLTFTENWINSKQNAEHVKFINSFLLGKRIDIKFQVSSLKILPT